MKERSILILILAILVSGGCTPSQSFGGDPVGLPHVTVEENIPEHTPQSTLQFLTPTMDRDTQTPLALSTPGGTLPMTPSVPGLEGLIEKAREDLAIRLSIPATEITVIEAAEVTWPDSSLGCPQKGMAYAEVLTQGYLIQLEYNHSIYEYHAGSGMEVFFCANPIPPVPGAPGIK